MILRCLVWVFWKNSDYLECIVLNNILDIVFSSSSPESLRTDELYQRLAAYINELITNDFEKLVQLLYRIDVNEAKLKMLLQSSPHEDAAKLIADLIIERQMQKIKSRKQFSAEAMDETDAEAW